MRKIISLLLILGGVAAFLYPVGSSIYNAHVARSEFCVYEETCQNSAAEKKADMLEAAVAYNQSLLTLQGSLQDPFHNNKKDKTNAWLYESLLDFGGQGLMGFVEIPCINEKLPVYHGTDESVLKKGVGHLKGSSLPVGGESTHAVLTGHTGMNRAKIFTDLTRVQEGDLFFIYIAGKTLAYRVDQIRVVLPEETAALAIVQGKDLVTLVTCTPYGINDHRLFVRGERTEYSDARYEAEKNKTPAGASQWLLAYQKAVLVGVILACLAFLFHMRLKRKKVRGHKI